MLARLGLRAEPEREDRKKDDPPADEVDGDCKRRTHPRLSLFQFDERSAKILGVEEENRLSVRAGLWLSVTQNAGSRGNQAIAGRKDIVDLIADVVNAAVGVPLQKLCDGRIGAQRFEQFDLRIWQRDENCGNAMIGLRNCV